MDRYDSVADALDYLVVRWIAQMTAVEIHAVWERYVEAPCRCSKSRAAPFLERAQYHWGE